jgi:hypothetical protein
MLTSAASIAVRAARSQGIARYLLHLPPAEEELPVSVDPLHTLRMVIQQIGVDNPSYRLVVYGDKEKPMHSDFLNAAALLAAISEAVPALDLKQHLLNPLREGQGSIVFTGEIALRASEISALGLK